MGYPIESGYDEVDEAYFRSRLDDFIAEHGEHGDGMDIFRGVLVANTLTLVVLVAIFFAIAMR